MQKMIDDAVEEFRKKLEKEFKEPELTGTLFECILLMGIGVALIAGYR